MQVYTIHQAHMQLLKRDYFCLTEKTNTFSAITRNSVIQFIIHVSFREDIFYSSQSARPS